MVSRTVNAPAFRVQRSPVRWTSCPLGHADFVFSSGGWVSCPEMLDFSKRDMGISMNVMTNHEIEGSYGMILIMGLN